MCIRDSVNVQLDPRHAASKHTTAPINHIRPSPRKNSPDVATRARKQTSDCILLLIYRPRKDERLIWPGWLVTYRNKVPPPGVEPRHVTHPSTNRARRRVTSLIRPTPLPLCHAAVILYKKHTHDLPWHDFIVFHILFTFCFVMAAVLELTERPVDDDKNECELPLFSVLCCRFVWVFVFVLLRLFVDNWFQ